MTLLALRTEDIKEFENMKNVFKVSYLSPDLEDNLLLLEIYILIKSKNVELLLHSYLSTDSTKFQSKIILATNLYFFAAITSKIKSSRDSIEQAQSYLNEAMKIF